MQMNSWYDIFENKNQIDRVKLLQEGKHEEVQNDIWNRYNQDDMIKSSDHLLELIEEEKKLLKDQSASRIFIGGMSQGCEVALATLLRYKGDSALAGVIGLSGILGYNFNKAGGLSEQQMAMIRKTPLFLYVGEDDSNCLLDVVNFSFKKLKDIYTTNGTLSRNYSFQTEEKMGHYMSDQEVKILRKWIKKQM